MTGGRYGLLLVLLGAVCGCSAGLHGAAEDGDVAALTEYLREGVYVDATQEGLTPLHHAASKGRELAAEMLIDWGANVNAPTLDGQTPLHLAAVNGHDGLVGRLLDHGAKVDLKAGSGNTALHLAAQKGHKAIARRLIARKADVNVLGESGWSPLHFAASENRCAVAKLLLASKAKVDCEGASALHVATVRNRRDMIEVLLEHGADPNAKDRDGHTPLHGELVVRYVSERQRQLHVVGRKPPVHQDVVRLLLDKGADPNAAIGTSATVKDLEERIRKTVSGVDAKVLAAMRPILAELVKKEATGSGDTPLHLEIRLRNGHLKIAQKLPNVMRLLLDKKADPNRKNRAGDTPLHLAAKLKQDDSVTLLLEYDVQPDIPRADGQTALHLATRLNRPEMVRALLDKGAKADAKMPDGDTALHKAARLGYAEVARALVAKGADVNAKAKDDMTPLHWAALMSRKDVVDLLVAKGADVNAKNQDGETPLKLAVGEDVYQLIRMRGGKE